ncbi:somatostatin receptor type 4-like [Patiria miniata]|uniref:G-protein coupled receptors family 1 profile domain-containing protein n=1 Tax=Patiria miniata TaxID=46514 RepID=A0A913Z3R4_PATMI|nr:somatostatin receptor type 4-like [Patiria miniata]
MPDIAEPNSILIGVEISLGIVGLIGNLLVAVAIVRSKSLHSLTHYFLLNLAIADSLVCVTGIVSSRFSILYIVCRQDTLSWHAVAAYTFLKRCIPEQSVLSLLLVTFERYIGIVHSLRHRSFFMRRRVIVLICFVWFTPVLVETRPSVWLLLRIQTLNCSEPEFVSNPDPNPYLHGIGFVILSALLLFAAPAAAMIWMYVQIVRDLKQSARRRQNLGMQGCYPAELHRARQRLTHTLLLVTAAFLALILPERVVSLVATAIFNNTSSESYGIALQCAVILSLINSAINPVLYGLKYDRFQQAIVSTFCCRSNTAVNQSNPHAKMNVQPLAPPQLRKLRTSPIYCETSV